MKVLFAFAGTGDLAISMKENIEQEKIDDNVIRIYFNGCQDSAVGGRMAFLGSISPNLDHVAAVIRKCFKDKTLSLKMLQQIMGNSIIIEPKSAQEGDQYTIDQILLTGFSRGAVTTFATARHLNDLDIPISLFAEDPTPGHSSSSAKDPDSQYSRNVDLTTCKNLTSAEVIMSYYHQLNFIFSTYGRQMAPKFGEQTEAAIFTVAKKSHKQWLYLTENHQIEFLKRCGLFADPGHYPYRSGCEFSVPKVARPPFHKGVLGRTEDSPLLKADMLKIINQKGYDLTKNSSFKVGQAVFALDMHSKDIFIPPDLLQRVLNDKTTRGKALREFIIEMNSIFIHSKQETQLTDKQLKILTHHLQSIFVLTDAFIKLNEPTILQRADFESSIFKEVDSLQHQISDTTFATYLKLTALFLEENTLTHPYLARFLDESETFEKGHAVYKPAMDTKVNTATELAAIFFSSPPSEREAIYEEYKSSLPNLIKTAEDLAEIGHFLTSNQLEAVLNPNLRLTITTVEKLLNIMEQLPTDIHRKKLYNAMCPYLSKMNLTLYQTLNLMEYLTLNLCNDVLKRIELKTMSRGGNNLGAVYHRLSPDKQTMIVDKGASIAFIVELSSSSSSHPAKAQQQFAAKYNSFKETKEIQTNLNEEGSESSASSKKGL